jgi:hypothetical protein
MALERPVTTNVWEGVVQPRRQREFMIDNAPHAASKIYLVADRFVSYVIQDRPAAEQASVLDLVKLVNGVADIQAGEASEAVIYVDQRYDAEAIMTAITRLLENIYRLERAYRMREAEKSV